MQFFSDTHIDFVGKRRMFYILSIVITVTGLLVAFVRGVDYGIDFEGGIETAFEFSEPVSTSQIRDVVTTAGFEGAEIKSYGADDRFLIRIKNPEEGEGTDAEVSEELEAALAGGLSGIDINLLQVNNVGPKIGDELRMQAFYAVLVAIIAIMLYITIRFEILFGLGAILALMHDVLVAFSFAVICNGLFGLNLEMNQGMLAAFLTVVGFSINDTVIIFDRIRENRQLHRGENLMMLINRSINETLPRTINTSLTVVLVLVILLFFAGETLEGFAFTMLIGILTGTYSSVYIASSFVIDALIARGKLDPNAQRDFTEQHTRALEEKRNRKGVPATGI